MPGAVLKVSGVAWEGRVLGWEGAGCWAGCSVLGRVPPRAAAPSRCPKSLPQGRTLRRVLAPAVARSLGEGEGGAALGARRRARRTAVRLRFGVEEVYLHFAPFPPEASFRHDCGYRYNRGINRGTLRLFRYVAIIYTHCTLSALACRSYSLRVGNVCT